MKNPAESQFTAAGDIFPAILDALEEPLFLLDSELRLTWYNRASDVLYYSVSGKHLGSHFDFNELLTTEQQFLFKAHLANVLAGQKVHFDWKYLQSITKWLSVSLYPCMAADGTFTGVCGHLRDITGQRHIEKERLQYQIGHQKEITRLMMHAQEAERNNLGRELHDNVNQLLAAVSLQLSYCRTNYDNARPVLEECHEYIQMAMEEIRGLSHRMVLPRFSASSLQYELNRLITYYRHTQDIRLDATEWNGAGIPPAIKETFFRIAQEQLHNIYKHARANKVLLCIKNDAESAFMSINDDGIGFNPCEERQGIGITNIINRAEAYNGSARFISAPEKGCTLLVSIPVSDQRPGHGPQPA